MDEFGKPSRILREESHRAPFIDSPYPGKSCDYVSKSWADDVEPAQVIDDGRDRYEITWVCIQVLRGSSVGTAEARWRVNGGKWQRKLERIERPQAVFWLDDKVGLNIGHLWK